VAQEYDQAVATSAERRLELRDAYERRERRAGVYLMRNTVTGRVLIGSSPDLQSVRNRLEFGQMTGSAGVLDRRMVSDAREHGMASFELEELDVLPEAPGASAAEEAADLDELAALWREKLASLPHY
jgi:hypothetical protein